jgi:hypothetical protein
MPEFHRHETCYVEREYGFKEVQRGVVRCVCGEEVVCEFFANTCDRCGRDYNMSGQMLADRSQWGEETGESLSDIIGPYDPREDY